MKTLIKIPDIFEKIIFKLLGDEGIYYINGTSTLPPPLEKEEENIKYFDSINAKSANDANKIIMQTIKIIIFLLI